MLIRSPAEGVFVLPGGEAVITRLGDILVVQAIRAWIETDPAARYSSVAAIVQDIARLYGGALELGDSRSLGGLRASLRLPSA